MANLLFIPLPAGHLPALPRSRRVDRLEGFYPGGRSLYRRVLVPVHARESIVSAWLYIGDTALRRGTKLIQSGIWSE